MLEVRSAPVASRARTLNIQMYKSVPKFKSLRFFQSIKEIKCHVLTLNVVQTFQRNTKEDILKNAGN